MNRATATRKAPSVLQPEYYQRLFDLEERHWWSQGMRLDMRALVGSLVQRRGPLRILDVGCGTGYLLTDLADWAGGAPIVGLDVSTHALRFCQHRGLDDLTCGSAVELPFADAAFDLVICIDVIQHLSPAGADDQALGEYARVLAPRGLLYLRTNSSLGHRRLDGVDPDLYRRYRRGDLSSRVEKAGLSVEKATYLNVVPSMWSALQEALDSSAGKVPPAGPTLTIEPPPPSPGILDRLAFGSVRLESWWLRRIGSRLPFGHSLAVVGRR
jgi:ubiquinone/menaquinone biosynthesis C-methylase UbiE